MLRSYMFDIFLILIFVSYTGINCHRMWLHRPLNNSQTFCIWYDYQRSVNEHSVCQVLGHNCRVRIMELYKTDT